MCRDSFWLKRTFAIDVAFGLLIATAGCRPPASGTGGGNAAAAKVEIVPQPPGKFLFQPYLYYEFKEPRADGTGFFVRLGDGRTFAIMSSNVLRLHDTKLTGIRALSIGDWAPIAALGRSWGKPGNGGLDGDDPDKDLRTDRLIMPVDERISDDRWLTLDGRKGPSVGEPVYFPDKMESEPRGYNWINGTVSDVGIGYIRVNLDSSKTLYTPEGSPVISAVTGRVIGSVSRFGKVRQKTVLWLCPAASLQEAIDSADSQPALCDVVSGK